MAHRGGPGWPGRGPRLYRPDNSSNYGPFPGRGGNRAAGGGGGPARGFRGGPPMPILRPRHPPPHPSHPPTSTPLSPPVVSYRHRGDELSAGSGREGGIVHREQYDYGHGRDRSRSPYASRESQYGSKQHCDINALLRDESMKITVGNDKFKDPQQTGSGVHSSSASQNAVLPTSRTSTQEYAEETASVARAKEMAMRTREMLSKLTGWTPISLKPTASTESAAKTGGRPNVVNVSNSAYTKLSASSEVAKTILRNMNAVAAAFCPKESGGVAHIRYTGGSEKAAKEDEDRFLYGEDLVPKNVEKPPVESGPIKSALRKVMPSGGETPARSGETGSNCDPVVADVLKSIGFNFELSKIMQEKAKKEREENDRNRLLIQQASSFLAKQLARSDAPDASAGAKSFENLRIVVSKDAGPSEILLDRTTKERKKQVLYDDFSNSEDEFCESERHVNVAASSNNSVTQPQTGSVVGSLPSNLTFPPSVPFSAPLLPTPPVAFPLSSAVPPPQITVPPHQILLPPQVISHPTMPQQPVWPGYQVLGANSVSKMRTGSHLSDEVEWEQNTEDFLRKLQEPRTNDAPPKPGTKVPSRPSLLQGPSDSERQRRTAPRRRKRNTSESPEPTKRRRKFGRKDSKNRFVDDDDWDANSTRRLASLREKLHSVKKEHGRLMCIRQKSAYVKDKLVSAARLQCKLMDEIEELERVERRGDRHEAAASGEESLPDNDRKKPDSKRASQTRSLNRKSREKSKERDEKASVSKGPGPDQRLSRTKVTRRSAGEQQKKPSANMEPEKTVQNSGTEVKSEPSSCPKSEIAVPAKEVIASQGTETGLKTNADKNAELKDPGDPSEKLEFQKSKKVKLRYDYYDGGDNRCSVCTKTFAKLVEFLQHLHSEAHEKKVDNHKAVVGKPWTLNRSLQPKPHNSVPPISVPASGMEFMKPIRGFFCTLCSQFSGDCEDAELHVLSEEHNEKFKKHCLANPASLNQFGIVKAETLKTEKTDSKETAGDVNDDDDDNNSNFLSETSKDNFESKAITKANQLAAKDTSIPASPSDSAAVEKLPRLRNEKEWNSEEKVGGSMEVEDVLDSGDVGSSSEVPKLRGSKMEAHSDEEGFGDPGTMQVSPPGAGTVTVEPSNGGMCSLVPYEDAEDNDLDWGAPSIAERVSVGCSPEKSDVDNEACANVCDMVDKMSENDTALVLSIVCPPESGTIVSNERMESPICPPEGSLSSQEKQKEALGFCISGEMSVTEAAEGSDSEPREILLGESVGGFEPTEPMVLEGDESSLPMVSTFSVQSEAVKRLLEEDPNACQSLESSVIEEEGDKDLVVEQPYVEPFEAVDLSFDDALKGFNFIKTSEGSLTSAPGTVINSEALESCAAEAFYDHGPMEPPAVRSFADVRRLEADVRCLEASNKGIVEICDAAAVSVDGKNTAACRSYLADTTRDKKGIDGIQPECTDDYVILLDDDEGDDNDALDTLLETCADVVPVDEDETQRRITGEDEAGTDY